MARRRRLSGRGVRLGRSVELTAGSAVAELQEMRETLHELLARRPGDHRPDCPIMDDLSAMREVAANA